MPRIGKVSSAQCSLPPQPKDCHPEWSAAERRISLIKEILRSAQDEMIGLFFRPGLEGINATHSVEVWNNHVLIYEHASLRKILFLALRYFTGRAAFLYRLSKCKAGNDCYSRTFRSFGHATNNLSLRSAGRRPPVLPHEAFRIRWEAGRHLIGISTRPREDGEDTTL